MGRTGQMESCPHRAPGPCDRFEYGEVQRRVLYLIMPAQSLLRVHEGTDVCVSERVREPMDVCVNVCVNQ